VRVLLINPPSVRGLGRGDVSVRLARKKAYLPPLGLITVAALLPASWRLKLIDCCFQTVSESDWNESDLVIVSGTIVQFHEIVATIREAKRRGKIVAVGGPGVFHSQQEVLKAGADFVVRGEGEVTVPLLLESLEKGEFGSVIEDLRPADMTTSPVPRYDLLDVGAYVDLSLQFSRGCPFRCEFCDVTLMFGRAIRSKTSEQILTELQGIYDLGWRRQVHFVDDNFVGNPTRTKALVREIIKWMDERGRPFEFYTYASVNLAGFPDLLDLMVRAGFTMVMLGIETTDKEVLRSAHKFQNAAVDLDEACRKINKAGLEIMALTMVGFDNELPGRDANIIEFATKNNIPEVCVSLVHAITGTSLWQRLKKEGRLLPEDTSELDDWHGLDVNFVPTRPLDEILVEFVNIHRVLYEPAHYLHRVYNHFASMDHPRFKHPFKLPSLYELRILLGVAWRHGLRSPTRLLYWKLSWKALLGFPRERFALFIRDCIKMERYEERTRQLCKLLERRSSAKAESEKLATRSGGGIA